MIRGRIARSARLVVPARLVVALAVAGPLLVALPGAGATGSAGVFTRDAAASAVVGEVVTTYRRTAGIEPLYARADYTAHAQAMALAAAQGTAVPAPRDSARSYAMAATVPTASLDDWVRRSASTIGSQLIGPIRTATFTDAGWSVVTRVDGPTTRLGVAAVVGWAPPAVAQNRACTGWGFCWTNRGLNPHLPWTRKQVVWKLSTAGMPRGADRLVRLAIARINATPGLGAELVYGGLTRATGPSGTDRFVAAFAPGCGARALGCATVQTAGATQLIYAARVVVNPTYYRATAVEATVGTLTHEIAHAMGLGHFDGRLADGVQLMHSAGPVNSPRTGDRNGLRTLNPPGQVTARLRLLTPEVAAGGVATAEVHGESTGLGSLRYLGVDCTDALGVWRTVAAVRGVFDPRTRDVRLSWTTSGHPRTSRCRAVVLSRLRRAESYATLAIS